LKSIILLFSILFLAGLAHGQTLKKMKIVELEDYIRHSNHPLLVSFWATYCVPCLEEIPLFSDITDKYKREGMELLLVSLDMPKNYPEKILKFAIEKKFPKGIAWLQETDADYFCPKIDEQWSGAIPASLFVNNKIHFRKFFEQAISEKELEKAVGEMLGK
jgi:thiol-disulfide isomerase/thioredoxin